MRLSPNLLTQIKAEKARRSLHQFAKEFWEVIEPSTEFVDGPHIEAICEHLEAVSRGEIRKLLINMPPRHMKSILVSVLWPAWEWATWPERRWLFASYAGSLAIRDSVKCRRLILSPKYQDWFGHKFRLVDDQNAKVRFENDKTGVRLSTSVDAAATGEGGDRIVVDDPHNVREAMSDTIRQAAITWWRESMTTRGNDPKTVAKVIVMQRVHFEDLSAYVLSEGGWEHLCLPAEYESTRKVGGVVVPTASIKTSIGWSDWRKVDGELLWSQRFGQPELAEQKRELGSIASAGQLQQSPTPASGGLLKRAWWKRWSESGEPGTVRLPRRFDKLILSWDCTFKDTDGTDYVVGQVWGKFQADFFLLWQVRDRMDLPATCDAVIDLAAKYPLAMGKLVEDKANGPAVISTLKRRIPGLIPVNPMGGKIVRASAVSPLIEAGNVFIPVAGSNNWVGDFVDECAAFPLGAHDDMVDSMSQALVYLSDRLQPKVVTQTALRGY